MQPEAGSWDVTEHGMVYGLAAGPYGSLLALCWNRAADTVALVLLDALHGAAPPHARQAGPSQAPSVLGPRPAPPRPAAAGSLVASAGPRPCALVWRGAVCGCR